MKTVTDQQRINLLDLDRQAMSGFFARMGEKPFRANQMLKWLHQERVSDFSQMTNFSKTLRAHLADHCEIIAPTIVDEHCSRDGTRKWVMQLACGNRIETVYIPEPGRATLCVSSQVGCALNCTFCSTAQQGFSRNLSVAEIIGQLWVAQQKMATEQPVTNVVMMGMGEPLLNFDNVVAATHLMMDDFAYGLSKRRVTLSTSGIVPAIDKLRAVTDVALAISLHATNDRLRSELMPINKTYPIAQLLAASQRYFADTNRKVTIEYVMLDGINDSPEDAWALSQLLRNLPCKINLIRFNPFPNSGYRCSPEARVTQFRDSLLNAGHVATTRRKRGDDIDAACGQLVGQVAARARRFQQTPNEISCSAA